MNARENIIITKLEQDKSNLIISELNRQTGIIFMKIQLHIFINKSASEFGKTDNI